MWKYGLTSAFDLSGILGGQQGNLTRLTHGESKETFHTGARLAWRCHKREFLLKFAMDRLNNRSRKTLGFATPNAVFFKDNNNKDTVALIV